MENTDGMIGMFEPMCKIRFLSDPKPDEDYIAVPASEMIDLIADQMKLIALDSGGVDNWNWYGESLHEYKKELPTFYGDKFWDWVNRVRSKDTTAEDYVDAMDFTDFAKYEVEMM